ncbi:hypothetical protein EVAR_45676_1 [Eumeta japonica]|uniref:Uncharacterized protein n=1 Tax=Eumeta variegata TaxID=151549 RepID=A0A4C1XHZ0_EUMVA|nr:hypothetical protein EVAR_45676_1 [Eumeta japonica]
MCGGLLGTRSAVAATGGVRWVGAVGSEQAGGERSHGASGRRVAFGQRGRGFLGSGTARACSHYAYIHTPSALEINKYYQEQGQVNMEDAQDFKASTSNCSHSNGGSISQGIILMEQNNFTKLPDHFF